MPQLEEDWFELFSRLDFLLVSRIGTLIPGLDNCSFCLYFWSLFWIFLNLVIFFYLELALTICQPSLAENNLVTIETYT